MTTKSCVIISLNNIFRKKRHTLRLLLNFFLLSCAVVIWLVLSHSLSTAQERFVYASSSINCESVSIELDAQTGFVNNENYEAVQKVGECEDVGTPVIIADIDLVKFMGAEERWYFVNNKFASLTVNGAVYQGINDYSYNFDSLSEEEKVTIPFEIGAVYSQDVFTANELEEFAYRYDNEEYMLCGTDVINDNEIIISDYMLEKLGYTDLPENILGKTITLSIEGKPVVESYKLVGVINSNIFYCENLHLSPQIYIRGNNQVTKDYGLDSAQATLPIRGYENIYDVFTALDDCGIQIDFFSYDRAKYYYNLTSIKTVVERVLLIFEVLVFLAILLNTYNIFVHAAVSRRENYGMMKAVGVTRPRLYLIAFFETLFTSVVATIAAEALSVAILEAMNGILESIIGIGMEVSLTEHLIIGAVSLLALLAIFMVIQFVVLSGYFSKNPIILLKGTRN